MKKIKKFIISLKNDNVSEYAAEAAYFSIISFIPFLIFLIELIKLSKIDKSTIYIILNEIFPFYISDIVFNLIEEIYNISIMPISFSIFIIIWSSGKGFYSLSKGIKKIYKVNIKNTFILRVKGTLYVIILTIFILLFLLLIVLGKSLYILCMQRYYQISFFIFVLYKLKNVFLILFMTIFVNYLYKFISYKKENIHLIGAFFSAMFWHIISYSITIYLNITNNFSFLYGSLSSIILIMLWIYFVMYIILIGAEINNLISDNNKKIKLKK